MDNIAYIVGGFPSLTHTKELICNLDKSKIDKLIINFPYSDPIADGEGIFEASFEVCKNKINVNDIFETLKQSKTKKDLILFCYFNMIFSYGVEKFLKQVKDCKAKALIVPDLPYEENEIFYNLCKNQNIDLIPIISITSEYRAKKVLSRASGFIYAFGLIGKTQNKIIAKDRVKIMIDDLHKMSNLPIFLDFDSQTDSLCNLKNYCDGVVIGKQIVKLCENFSGEELIEKIDQIFA